MEEARKTKELRTEPRVPRREVGPGSRAVPTVDMAVANRSTPVAAPRACALPITMAARSLASCWDRDARRRGTMAGTAVVHPAKGLWGTSLLMLLSGGPASGVGCAAVLLAVGMRALSANRMTDLLPRFAR